MPKRETIRKGDSVDTPQTIEDFEKAAKQAQKDFETLMKERRKNRNEMSRADFRKYNEETATRQIETQKRLRDAERALSRALGREEQRVKVETAKEKSEAK